MTYVLFSISLSTPLLLFPSSPGCAAKPTSVRSFTFVFILAVKPNDNITPTCTKECFISPGRESLDAVSWCHANNITIQEKRGTI